MGKLRPGLKSAVHKVKNDLVTEPKASAIPPDFHHCPFLCALERDQSSAKGTEGRYSEKEERSKEEEQSERGRSSSTKHLRTME